MTGNEETKPSVEVKDDESPPMTKRKKSKRRSSTKSAKNKVKKEKDTTKEMNSAPPVVFPMSDDEEPQPYSMSTSRSKKSKEETTEVMDDVPLGGDSSWSTSAEKEDIPVTSTSFWNVVPAEDALHLNSFFQRESKRVARCSCTYFWVAFILSLSLSFIALIVGEFEVSAETSGWQSRGTLIADRQTQRMLVTGYQTTLFYGGSEAWDELINNVQPGWDSESDDDDGRRLSKVEESYYASSILDAMVPRSNHVEEHHSFISQKSPPFVLTPDLKRRLQETAVETDSALAGCDVSFYDSYNMTYESRLWPTWRVTDPSKTALDPSVLKDLCIAEENTQKTLMDQGLCFGCDNGRCLPPYSLVFYARLNVLRGFSMDCETLATMWEPLQESTEALWSQCVSLIKKTYDPNNSELPEDCPFGFYPTVVQADFDDTMMTTYTSTIFATEESVVDDLYAHNGAYDRGSAVIEGAYDTQYEDFIGLYLDASLGQDMALALGSAVVVSLAIIIHTRSPLITGVGLLQIILSFPLAYFIYKLVAGLDFFPFLNFIGIFVVFALGAGDIFVAIDKWKNARIAFPMHTYSTEYVAAKALPDAAYAMFLTTITTAIAFFATAICPVAPIKMFAIFCGLLIMFDYIMNVLLVFPALCIYDKAMVARETDGPSKGCVGGCWGCCVSCSCCGLFGPNKGHIDELEDAVAGEHRVTASKFIKTQSRDFELAQQDEEDVKANASLIQRIMLGFYGIIHKFRWILFVICLGAFGVCVYYATTLKLPTSSDVRLLDPDHEYEKSFEWRQQLLSEQLEKLSGSTAHFIWGVTPADTGDQNNPASWSQLVLDDSFDPSPEASQEFLLSFCDQLFAQDFAEEVDNEFVCSMARFDEWLTEQSSALSPDEGYAENCGSASGIPVPQANLHACMSYWAASVDDTSVLSRDGVVKIIVLPFSSRVRFDSFFDVLKAEWELIEDWTTTMNDAAPSNVNMGYFTSEDFWWYDTNSQMLSTAYSAAAIALGASAAVILISSRSIVMTLFSTLTIGFVLTSVTSVLVAIGWTLGFLESICFAILIGVSVDFVIHLAHAYASKHGQVTRGDRTKYALVKMGPSILATAVTTILSAVVMLFTIITFFQKFALILFVTIIMASLGSFIFLITLLDCIGPSNPTYFADKLSEICCSKQKDSENAVATQTEN